MTVDKLIMMVLVSVISAVILFWVVGALALQPVGAVLLTMFANASVSFMPRDHGAVETRVNSWLAVIAALISLVITGFAILLGVDAAIGAGLATLVSSLVINTLAIRIYAGPSETSS